MVPGSEPPPADVVAHAGLSAPDAARHATLPEGFKMHVFAAEPDVQQPIAFCLDDRGRVWVAEGLTYPRRRGHPPAQAVAPGASASARARGEFNPGRAASAEGLKDIFNGLDRILVFEDTDGDHVFDRRTVFLENVNLISGLAWGFGGLWIGAAPYLLYVPVTDGDAPKPATDPRLVLDGWNYSADTHETLNTFVWGPDGWLYGCHGVFCPSNVGRPGGPESERQWMDAGVWRYHPVRDAFEVFTEGGSNPWGIDFNEQGQLFAEMCVIPHFWQMIQGARIQRQGGEHFAINREEIARNERHRDSRSRKPVFPYVFEDIKQHGDHVHWLGNAGPHAANARSDAAGGGHAHAGVLCYLGASWPEDYRGRLFIGNIHGQRLNVDIPVRQGSGYAGRHGPDFLNFNDTWSQTLNQICDPDGSVYIIDWYDKNQCHHNREDGHDRSNGRIYKIVYKNQAVTHPDLPALGDDALVRLVPSKNEWMSRHARRLLQERAAASTLADGTRGAIARVFRTGATSSEKLRGLWALHVTGGLGSREYVEALTSGDEWLRAWAIQLAFEKDGPTRPFAADSLPAADAELIRTRLSLAQLAASDPSPVVRLYIASALQRLPVGDRFEVLRALLERAEDSGDHNLPLMYWYAAEGLVASNPEQGLELLKRCRIPKVREWIARRLATMSLTRVN